MIERATPRSTLKTLGRVPAAVLRRMLPRSLRFGFRWIAYPDGSITFREDGFVAASSPAMLLVRHNYETTYIRRLLTGRSASRSLEIGCGFGRLTPTFASFSDDHIAIDINPAALEMARTSYPQLQFRQVSATELPFLPASFDLITTWTVLQHVPPDRIAQACAEIVRVLAPGGTLLICEETRHATAPAIARAHTWHRQAEEYARLLEPLVLDYSSNIEELETISARDSPGTVMRWRSPKPGPAH